MTEAPSSKAAVQNREDPVAMATLLAQRGVLSDRDVRDVNNQAAVVAARLQANRRDRRPPAAVETLVAMELTDRRTEEPLTAQQMMEEVSAALELPFERIDPLKLDSEFSTRFFSRPFAERHGMIPLRESEESVIIATSRPFDQEGLEVARKTVRKPVEFVAALPDEVMQVIREFYGFRSSVKQAQRQMRGPRVDIQNLEQLVQVRGDRELEASDQHVVNAVEYLFRYALELRASDVHLEPKREQSHVRLRIDGVLHHIYSVPRTVHLAMVSRIKMMARLDIAEKRRPQDGRIKMVEEEREVEMRVSAMPVAFGEKVVIRIFDPLTVHGDLGKLGFRGDELATFRKWITEPHGVILVTGPTGSGKSTTLYTALMNVANEELNVITVEDPIEMLFEHLNQVAVQPQVGITFASALRTILRQDPDVIMVGEIRDRETAEYAIQAALTGHLVFSTLHTNDAIGAIPRMVDLGVERFLLSSALTGVMAQRLVRQVCVNCAVERLIPAPELTALGAKVADAVEAVPVVEGEGCAECRGTGYRGRMAIFEMVDVDPGLRAAIDEAADVDDLRAHAARQGTRTLREAGLALVQEGLTTVEEVLRVTADADL